MKILLINPNRTYYEGSKDIRLGLPLGLLYIASVLEKNNLEPKIFDCLISDKSKIVEYEDVVVHGVSDEVVLDKIKEESPDVVGITSPFTAQIDNAIHLADLVKHVDDKIITVIGGPHIAIRGKEILQENNNIDIGIKGEGEDVFTELIKKLKENQPIDQVKSIFYRDKAGEVIENEFGGLIKNLDDLPYPAYHLIDMDNYFDLIANSLKTRPGINQRSISMITSRGCPYNCIFCSIHLHMGKMFRAHSTEYVINSIRHVADKYKIKHISFEDDNFTLDINRAKKILKGIIDNNIKITWDTPNGVRADRIDEELLKLIKESGCVELTFGIESGNQRVLDEVIQKNLKLSDVIKAVELTKKYGIKTKAFFVIGFPGETKEEIKQTADYIIKLRKKYNVEAGPLIATPLIGTRLYELCKEKGFLVKEPDPRSLAGATQYHGQGLIKTNEFDPEFLKDIAGDVIKSIYRLRMKEKILKPPTYWSSIKTIIMHPPKAIDIIKSLQKDKKFRQSHP